VIRYFADGIKKRRRISYRFRLAFASSGCDIDPITVFDATNYRVVSVVIEYYKKILIISVSIRLHGIWYF